MSRNKSLKKTDENQASQSNSLVESSYKMSVPAKRVMLLLLSKIHPAQQDVTTKITIQARDYSEKTGLSFAQSYRDIKNGCRELMKTIITMKDLEAKTTEECVVVSWMKHHENEGWLEATFSLWIMPHIHRMTRLGYTTIAVNEAIKFKSFNTIRLYEILMQWDSTGKRFISIEDLRHAFQIPPKSYAAFRDFRVKVIDPSVKEINEKTSWEITWEAIKTGKKITSVRFLFHKPS
jgi:plasmid replication initiation protein